MSPQIVCNSFIITLSVLLSTNPLRIKADSIIAQAFEYQDKTIICSGNEACLIYCKKESSCENAKIFCPVNEPCIVFCGGSSNACYGALIDARYSSTFELSDCASGDTSTCSAMTIYFPPNQYGQKRSWLQVGNNFKSQLTFYALFGWDDIDISGFNGEYNQIDAEMYCQYGYTEHCIISNTQWTCSNPVHPCNNPLNSTINSPSPTIITPNTTTFTTPNATIISITPSATTTNIATNVTFLKVLRSIELSWYIIALLISIMLCCSCCMILILYHFTQQQQKAISSQQQQQQQHSSQYKLSYASNPPEPSTSHTHRMTVLDGNHVTHHLLAPKDLTIMAPKSAPHIFQHSPMSELTSPSIPCYHQSGNTSATKLTQQKLPKPIFDRKSKSSPPFPQVPVPPVSNPVHRHHRVSFLETMAADSGHTNITADTITAQTSQLTNNSSASKSEETTLSKHKSHGGFGMFNLPKRRIQTMDTDHSLPPLHPTMTDFVPSNSSQLHEIEQAEEHEIIDVVDCVNDEHDVNVNDDNDQRSETEEFENNDGFEHQFKYIMNNISSKLNAPVPTPHGRHTPDTPHTPDAEAETQDDLLSNATVYPKSPGASAFATTEATQLSEVTSHHGSNDSFQWTGIDGHSSDSVIKTRDLPPPPQAIHSNHSTQTESKETCSTTKSPLLKPLVSPITKSPLSTITSSSTPKLTLKITDVSSDTQNTQNTQKTMNTNYSMNTLTRDTAAESVTVTGVETSDAASMTYMTATTINPPQLTLSAKTGSGSASSDTISTPIARSGGTASDEGDDLDIHEDGRLLKVPHATSNTISSSDDDPRVDTISILSLSNDADGSIKRLTSSEVGDGTESGSTNSTHSSHSCHSDATVMFGDSSSAASSAPSSGDSESVGDIVGLLDMRANEGTIDDMGLSQSWLTDIIEDGDENEKESSIPVYVQENGTFHTDQKILKYDTVDGDVHE